MARKILLADDSVTAQNMGRKILADAGYEVITVNNGSAALKKIAELKPELVILDVYMPGYSGLEVCSRLKETGETSRLPVLLTVGKLEPFKPEEAKRVRADGFIVKPFEASELLSALSKLEDKIVPRAEPSKPGRLSRAIASVEASDRNSKSDASADTGWKSRIGFPHDKAKPDEDGDNSALYNAVNRDLRTVVDPGPAAKAPPAEESHQAGEKPQRWIDAGAGTVPGLPDDVTADEIAGLAAAMAQVQATLTAKESEAASVTASIVSAAELAAATKAQAQIEAKAGTTPEPALHQNATFAEQSSAELQTTVAGVSRDSQPDVPPASNADMMAAIAALEAANGKGWGPEGLETAGSETGGPGNGAGHSVAGETADIPATMAAASRWTAVPVGLDADEAAGSLEQEMQKAYAYLAPESAPTGLAEPGAASEAGVAISSPVAAAVVEAADNLPSRAEQELAMALSAAANAPPEEVRAVATEPAAASAAYPEVQTDVQSTDVQSNVQTDVQSDVQSNVQSDLQTSVSAESDSAPTAPILAAPILAAQISEITQQSEPAPPAAEMTPAPESVVVAPVMQQPEEEPAQAIEPPVPANQDISVAVQDSHHHPEFDSQPVSAQAETSPAGSDSALAAAAEIAEDREPDLAATTAAAWANWRQIRSSRETRNAEPAQGGQREIEEGESTPPRDKAAMAVAAGAEKAPEAAPDDDPAIASIVDSVLADLRPKIVEEISRKLRKKK